MWIGAARSLFCRPQCHWLLPDRLCFIYFALDFISVQSFSTRVSRQFEEEKVAGNPPVLQNNISHSWQEKLTLSFIGSNDNIFLRQHSNGQNCLFCKQNILYDEYIFTIRYPYTIKIGLLNERLDWLLIVHNINSLRDR